MNIICEIIGHKLIPNPSSTNFICTRCGKYFKNKTQADIIEQEAKKNETPKTT